MLAMGIQSPRDAGSTGGSMSKLSRASQKNGSGKHLGSGGNPRAQFVPKGLDRESNMLMFVRGWVATSTGSQIQPNVSWNAPLAWQVRRWTWEADRAAASYGGGIDWLADRH